MSLPPDGSWDCHAHVIEDPARYPLFPGRNYDPPAAPLEAYLAMLDRNHLARGVLVQPSVYGFDNRCLLDALDRADGRLLGIVVPDPGAPPRDLEAMHRRGARGVRCNLLHPGPLEIEHILRWHDTLRDLGWHVELHAAIDAIDDLGGLVRRFEVPVVIDHMGRPAPGRADPAAPALQRLVDLVGEGACFVKLSAPYRLSAQPPPWDDVTPLARALVAANPARCIWATDWPHTSTPQVISEAHLLAALAEWCPEESTRRIVTDRAPRDLFQPP